MRISMIAAMTPQRVIGSDGVMPWHLPADLRWFREVTLYKPVIMGRTTWQSIGRSLPKRRNIVLSHDKTLELPGAEVVVSVDRALSLLQESDEVMVIGGAQIYTQFLPLAQRLYITRIQAEYPGDAWFPQYDAEQWQEVFCIDCVASEDSPSCSFMVLDRCVEPR